ncbi:MAG: exodeoxyribonuclease III [Deltaproteobacteria bacterium]|nr:exodeoxyribonuclease III [Deltaproteobacteria bacterium]
MRRFVSWNVNGIRACVRKGFLEWLPTARADVIGLQETRCERDDLPEALHRLPGLRHAHWVSARSRRGYSGVAILSRRAPGWVEDGLGDEAYDREGRFLLARFDDVLLANVYFPKGSGTQRDNSRVPYKLAFTERVFDVLRHARRRYGLPVILMGDLNVAPSPIDLARPRGNETTSGFLPEERALLARCTARTWVDTYRALHPDGIQYSWWSNRTGVRERNVGWRIDHVLVTAELAARVRRAFVWDHVRGSDHCPVGIDLADAAR